MGNNPMKSGRIFVRLTNPDTELETVLQVLTQFLIDKLVAPFDHISFGHIPLDSSNGKVNEILDGWCTFDIETEDHEGLANLINKYKDKLENIDAAICGTDNFGDYVIQQLKVVLGKEQSH